MQMLKRFSFSLLIVALILSCYAVPEVAAEGSDHVTMSKGDGYALYNGVKVLASEVPEGAESIPLDGMNVIEWDGDTTGLDSLGNAGVFYRVIDVAHIDVDKSVVFLYGITPSVTQPSDRSGIYHIGSPVRYVATANDTYPLTGLFFRRTSSMYVKLVAYYPIEETTVDYTLTYSTEHGTAPGNKTVTVNVGESYTLTDVDLPTLSAVGYVFKGWTANGAPVFAGNTIDGDIHLVASWELEPVLDPPVDPDPPQPPPDEEPDGNGIEAVKALIDAVVGVMQIEFTLWGFTFTFWQMMLFGIFVYIASWFIGGFFND